MFVFASDKSIQVYNSTKLLLETTMKTTHSIEALEYIGDHQIACGLRDGSIEIMNLGFTSCKNIIFKLHNDSSFKSLHWFDNNNVLAAVSFREKLKKEKKSAIFPD